MKEHLASWPCAAHPGLGPALERALADHAHPETLAALGAEREAARRLDAQARPARPEADAEAAALWQRWFDGDPWPVRARWEALWLPAATRSFRALMAARRLPPTVRERVIRDLREGYFYALLQGDTPGWALLAARCVESDGDSFALGPLVDAAGRERALGCARQRGAWARSLRSLKLADSTAFPLELLLDAHVLLRAAEGEDLPAARERAAQNHARGRARLRALVAESAGLRGRLMALPALARRTEEATARFAWSWAWEELARDFPMEAPPGRPCLPVQAPRPPLDEAEEEALRTWVLLCALRGRREHLRRWVMDGRTADRDSTWGRLLAEELPPGLRRGGLAELRGELRERLAPLLAHADSRLALLADLEADRRLPERARAALQSGWSPQVRFPSGGFPRMREIAIATRAAGEAR